MKLFKVALPMAMASAMVMILTLVPAMAAGNALEITNNSMTPMTPMTPMGVDSIAVPNEKVLITFQATPTASLTIPTDGFLNAVFTYANVIIAGLVELAGIKAGIAFGFRVLAQIGGIFGGG